MSWGLALFEYFFQVPANKIGYEAIKGKTSLIRIKVIEKNLITLVIFVIFSMVFFKNETFEWNHADTFFVF